MVESKDNRSQFIPYETNAVRFSVDAFMFKRMSGQVSKTFAINCLVFV